MVWNKATLLLTALGSLGWLLLGSFLWFVQGSYLSPVIWMTALLAAVMVSTVVILVACVRRAWVAALVSVVLAAAGVVATTRRNSEVDYVDHQYRAHRAALAALAEEYRAGRLNGDLTLPPDVRSLSPSGFAYADATVLYVQMWQNWRAESGTGLGYFPEPPTGRAIQTASGDRGEPRREVGDGWWWVA